MNSNGPSASSSGRRAVLLGSLGAAFAAKLRVAMAAHFIDLSYADGRLSWTGGTTKAACGRTGVRGDKNEGDGASPAGTFALLRAYYRPDRLALPPSGLPVAALAPSDGWVDDPADPRYNRLVALPYPAHHEELWRDDGLYDVIVVIGYNTDPVVPGRGSAIFLHVARDLGPELAPTEGCIAIERGVLIDLLARLGPGSTIAIRP